MSVGVNNRQGAATQARLIKTAERLFAEHGADGVSVRSINAAAGLGPASVHYHFGSKKDLIAAVLLDLGAPVRDQIRANTEALAARPDAPSTEALVRAVTEPYLALLQRHRTRGMRWVKIVTQLSRQGHPAFELTEQHLRDRLLEQVRRAFPHADPDRVAQRWAIAVMGFLQALSGADDWCPGGGRLSAEALIDFYADQVSFLVGGLDRLLGGVAVPGRY